MCIYVFTNFLLQIRNPETIAEENSNNQNNNTSNGQPSNNIQNSHNEDSSDDDEHSHLKDLLNKSFSENDNSDSDYMASECYCPESENSSAYSSLSDTDAHAEVVSFCYCLKKIKFEI